jgi:hypothetical protein
MARYRTKPCEIDAIQLTQDTETIAAIIEWIDDIDMSTCGFARSATINKVLEDEYLPIQTLEGEMRASFGDYIIKGLAGEFYPCKPDIFKQKYEPIDN